MLEAQDFTVIVEVLEEKKVTESGLHLPDTYYTDNVKAQVVASGVDGLNYSDLVYIQPQRGLRLTHQGKDYLVLDQSFVLAKIVGGVDVDQDGNVVQPFELVTGDFDDVPF